MTKQLDAAVWILDSNELASFQHGDFLLHYCEPKPCSIVLEDVSKVTRKFEFSLVCFQLTLTYLSTVQLLAFLLLQCFILPHPLLLQISPLLFALLSFLFFISTNYPVSSSIISPSSSCAFHRTLHCPLLSFSKSQQLVGCLWHQGPDWAPACSYRGGYCLTGWARSPVSLLAPSVCLLGHNSRAWSEHERLGSGERGSSRNDENIGFRLTENKWDWMTVWADSSRLWWP